MTALRLLWTPIGALPSQVNPKLKQLPVWRRCSGWCCYKLSVTSWHLANEELLHTVESSISAELHSPKVLGVIPGIAELVRVYNASFESIYRYTYITKVVKKKVSRLLTLFPDFSLHSRDDGMQHGYAQPRPQKAIRRGNEY